MFALVFALLQWMNNSCLFVAYLLVVAFYCCTILKVAFVSLQAEANSPEQFVGIILREKLSGTFINDVYNIYSGEVEAWSPRIGIPFNVFNVDNGRVLVDFGLTLESFLNYYTQLCYTRM